MTIRCSISALAFAALLAGCGMAGSPGAGAPSSTELSLQSTASPQKIYVANIGSGTITSYLADGTQTSPTITTGNYLFGIAVAPTGKIYALTFNPLGGPDTSGTVTSFKPDGTKTTPTITIKERGYHSPSGIAVDASGKIYVLSSEHDGTRGTVTTFNPDGSRAALTFRTGDDSSGIAIDANGKIYVTNDTGPGGKSSVTTYLPDGSPTTPTIVKRIHQPVAVAVAADGTIFIANTNNRGHDGTGAGDLASYAADGSGPLHTIVDRESPGGIAVTATSVYLASSDAYDSTFKTYTLAGRRISPTIATGLNEPSGIALSP